MDEQQSRRKCDAQGARHSERGSKRSKEAQRGQIGFELGYDENWRGMNSTIAICDVFVGGRWRKWTLGKKNVEEGRSQNSLRKVSAHESINQSIN
jgi:hypothetical protein